MHYWRTAELRLDRDEWFDATVSTEDSNAGGVKPFRRMRVQSLQLRDNIDGTAPRLHASGCWYKADGDLSRSGEARASLPWEQMPEQISSAVSRIVRTYRTSGGES